MKTYALSLLTDDLQTLKYTHWNYLNTTFFVKSENATYVYASMYLPHYD